MRRRGAAKSTTFRSPHPLTERFPWSGIILLCFYESLMCVRCQRLGVSMRARCTMPRHAIVDVHNSLLSITDPETVNLGYHRGRLGYVRSLTRSGPDNTGDRSDPIRSRPIPDNDKRVSSRPVSSLTANDRCPCDKCQFSLVSEARRHPNARFPPRSSACDGTRDRHRPRRQLRPTSASLLDDRHCVLSGITRIAKCGFVLRRGSFTSSLRKRSWISSSAVSSRDD